MKYKIRFKAQDAPRKYVNKNFSSSEYLSIEKEGIAIDVYVSKDMSEVYFRYPDFKNDHWFIPNLIWKNSDGDEKFYLRASSNLTKIKGKYIKINITVDRFLVALYGDRNGNKNIDYENITDFAKKFHVHHIDDNTRNNSLDNLLILTPNEHSFFAAPQRAKDYLNGEVSDWEIVNLQKIIKKYKLEDLYPEELSLVISEVEYKPSVVYPVEKKGITCYFWCNENGEKGQWSFNKKEWYNVNRRDRDNTANLTVRRKINNEIISFSATIKLMVLKLHGDMFGTKYTSLLGTSIQFKDGNPLNVRSDNMYLTLSKNTKAKFQPTEDTYRKIKANTDKLLKEKLIDKKPRGLLKYDDLERYANTQKEGGTTAKVPTEKLVADYKSGMTVNEMMDKYNMKEGAIRYHLAKAGLVLQKKEEIDVQQLIKDYNQGMDYKALSRKYNRSDTFVRKTLMNNGIQLKDVFAAAKSLPIDEVIQLYKQGESVNKIGKKYGVTHTTIINKLKQSGEYKNN